MRLRYTRESSTRWTSDLKLSSNALKVCLRPFVGSSPGDFDRTLVRTFRLEIMDNLKIQRAKLSIIQRLCIGNI